MKTESITAHESTSEAGLVPYGIFALLLNHKTLPMKACLAMAVLLVALLAPSVSAQHIYIANAGEDTVSKIDINSNTEVARYGTWFNSNPNFFPHPGNPWAGPAPSRLVKDSVGNLFALNRFFPPGTPNVLNPPHLPVLVKIAPFGAGATSTGSLPLPVTDINPTDNRLDPGEATDVRILWGSEIGTAGIDEGKLGRSLCIDPSGVLWVGIFSTQRYYKVNATTGQVIGAPILTPGHTPYGCQVDVNGKLWSIDLSKTLAEIDTVTNQVTIHDHGTPTDFGGNYSLSLFNGCRGEHTRVYISSLSGKTYIVYDTQTSSFSAAPLPATALFSSYAVAVDKNGDIISAALSGGRVIKSTKTGAILWDTNAVGSTVSAVDSHGAIVDDQNNVWIVHRLENRVVKYSGANGQYLATVPVGDSPYSYGNPPPPSCPCAEVREQRISCEKLSNGVATYPFSFTFTNNSPFATPATTLNITSTQVTNITPSPFVFTTPVPVNGQATVTGTFSVTNPVPGSQVCMDIRLNAGEGWCCPTQQVCFVLPECPGCAQVKAAFKCQHGKPVLSLQVTNQGPTAAQGMQVFSNTPGVTVSPQTVTQTFPQNSQVQVPLNVTGATPGQTISLTISLNGPMDPKTGVYDWCCSTTVTVVYPREGCPTQVDGAIFHDLNRNGLRDSGEDPLSGWTVTLTDAKGVTLTTRSDSYGTYHFENVAPGTYRLAGQAQAGWQSTAPEGGYTVNAGRPLERRLELGFVKVQ